MNSVVHFKGRAVGYKWVRWLGAFWSWGHELCLNRQQRPLIPVRDTSLWFWSPAQHRPSSEHTHKQICTCTHTLAFSTITEFQGRWLCYCCCNTALIQGRSDLSLFFSPSASLDQVLILPLPHEWSTQEELHLLLPHASNVTQVHMLSCSFW